jgi:eukaryotic-like serine/threonine-protein kinase
MGHVWLARDEKSGLDVALKIVAREGKSGHRAEREARAASSLRHRHCQRILALARDPSHVYIAYEYVPGRTMREALRAGELDDRAVLEVCGQIADALAHAHRRGIVHRDVKPSNVLLAESPNIDVRLLDFGLAQMAEFDTLTGLGDIPGTLAYISPERLQGLPATPAADVWGLGVVLWEALAGEHPFWGGDLSETSRIIQQGAPLLETRRPDLPSHLLETVAGALVTSPQRRPSAERLATELRSLPRRKRKTRSAGPAAPAKSLPEVARDRLLPGALAGVASGWVAAALPFYPAGWPFGLAAAAALLGFAAPRAGLLFTLATAFFPLANISFGLAGAYAALAVLWAALNWRDARTGLLLALGPIVAPLAALPLLPLTTRTAGSSRRPARRRRRGDPPRPAAVRRLDASPRYRSRGLDSPDCRRRRALGAARRPPGDHRRGADPRPGRGGPAARTRPRALARGRVLGRAAEPHRDHRARGGPAAPGRRSVADGRGARLPAAYINLIAGGTPPAAYVRPA